jgi:hypothetical protein
VLPTLLKAPPLGPDPAGLPPADAEGDPGHRLLLSARATVDRRLPLLLAVSVGLPGDPGDTAAVLPAAPAAAAAPWTCRPPEPLPLPWLNSARRAAPLLPPLVLPALL